MLAASLFWGLTLTCCGFAAAYGGRAGRQVAALYVLACLATMAAWLVQLAWTHTHYAIFAVDCALLVALVAVALGSDRWFPTWFAGFHLVAVVSHLASIIAPGFAPKVYFLLQGFWSVPMLLSLVIGVALDRRQGIKDEPATDRMAGQRAGRARRPARS